MKLSSFFSGARNASMADVPRGRAAPPAERERTTAARMVVARSKTTTAADAALAHSLRGRCDSEVIYGKDVVANMESLGKRDRGLAHSRWIKTLKVTKWRMWYREGGGGAARGRH